MSIVEAINQGIKDSIRKQDQIRLMALRMLKSIILSVDARGNIPEQEIIKLFKTHYGKLSEALEQAVALNRHDIAEKLKLELVIVQEFLPKTPSLEETKKIILQAIHESGAKSKKDLGLVMKAAMKINQNIDGKTAKHLAEELLN